MLPHSVIDRRNRPGIAYGAEGAIVTLDVRVDRHQPPPRGNKSVPTASLRMTTPARSR